MTVKHTPGYTVEENGDVYSIGYNWRGYGKRKMVPSKDKDGYLYVRLMIDNRRLKFRIHQLVAFRYIGPKPSKDYQVRHLDGDKLNNHYTNLAWGTAKENADDRERHNRTSRGFRHSQFIKSGIYAR